jgi:putative transposase
MPYYKLYYHIVWGTKNRQGIILPDFESDLYRVIAAKVIDMNGIVHAIGRMEDHVHLAVTIPPKYALSKVIGEIKGNSSHAVNHVIKPGLNFSWQEEYGVFSFGEKNLPGIVHYIQNQKQHHAKNTIQAYMESW